MPSKEMVIAQIRESVTNSPAVQAEIDGLERATQYRLSDAMREGSKATTQAYNWGSGDTACAWSAAVAAAKARKYVA